ncbi:MAG: hypothetical protein L3J22_02575 [Xanthomonadales bacterium]|nr:hypothetical protein [Xanthomonadales bacterium]
MKSLITRLTATILFSLLVAPVNAQITTAVEAGGVGYPGSYTIADIVDDHIAKTFAVDPDAKINIIVSIPIIKNNQVLVNDLSGLPGLPVNKSADEEAITNAAIEIPFAVDDFKTGGELDSLAFLDHLSSSLERLTIPSPMQSKSKDSGSFTQGGGLENSSNCGGYSVGTTLTVTTSSCMFGTISNTYTCQSNPATGRNDWYITSSYSLPPDVACIAP